MCVCVQVFNFMLTISWNILFSAFFNNASGFFSFKLTSPTLTALQGFSGWPVLLTKKNGESPHSLVGFGPRTNNPVQICFKCLYRASTKKKNTTKNNNKNFFSPVHIPHISQRRCTSQQWPPVQERKVNPHDKDEKALQEIKSWRCCRRGNVEEIYLITSKNIPDCGNKWSMKAKREAKVCNSSARVVYREERKIKGEQWLKRHDQKGEEYGTEHC